MSDWTNFDNKDIVLAKEPFREDGIVQGIKPDWETSRTFAIRTKAIKEVLKDMTFDGTVDDHYSQFN